MKDAQINYDKNLRLQYLAGMSLNTHLEIQILQDITKTYQFPTNLFVGGTGRFALEGRLNNLRKPGGFAAVVPPLSRATDGTLP
jgi:spermidine synthase